MQAPASVALALAAADVVNAIARLTGGNFRLVQRLFVDIERVLAVNALPAVTPEVVALVLLQ